MQEATIIEKKQHGDIKTVSQLTGLKPNNICNILARPKAKRRAEVLKALAQVVESRERLIKNIPNA